MRYQPESKLEMLRRRRFMTQSQLAKEIGVSAHTISRWESGDQQPRLTPIQFKKLIKVLEITVDELPDYFGEKSPSENSLENSQLSDRKN